MDKKENEWKKTKYDLEARILVFISYQVFVIKYYLEAQKQTCMAFRFVSAWNLEFKEKRTDSL